MTHWATKLLNGLAHDSKTLAVPVELLVASMHRPETAFFRYFERAFDTIKCLSKPPKCPPMPITVPVIAKI
jgi:hypothetical protein